MISLTVLSCSDNPNFSDVPEIEFLSFSKNELTQNSLNTDSLFIRISFQDGDGDIGLDESDISQNLILTDNRTGEVFDRYKIPTIPIQGAQNGIQGEIMIKVFTTCCIFPDMIPPCESPVSFPTNELSFDIQLTDRAGNDSNVVTTQSITLLCN